MYEYRINQDGSYSLLDTNYGDELSRMNEVAVAFSWDGEHAVLHKHGDPSRVRRLAKETAKKYVQAGLPDDIYTIIGKFPLDTLGKLIDISGFIDVYLRRSLLLDAMQKNPSARTFRPIDKDGWEGGIADEITLDNAHPAP